MPDLPSLGWDGSLLRLAVAAAFLTSGGNVVRTDPSRIAAQSELPGVREARWA